MALFAALVLASFLAPGPVVQADEGSYLLNAAAIAGLLERSALVRDYYSGYSLLLTPAYFLFSDLDRIYRCVLVINALLIASLPIALYRLIALLRPELGQRWHVRAAVAASSYAPVLVLSQYAVSENALVPIYAWTLVAGTVMLLRSATSAAIVCGGLSGALFLIHARGATLALPLLFALSLPSIRNKELRWPTLMLWSSAVLVGALHGPLELLAGKIPGVHIAGDSLDDVLGRFRHLAAWGTATLNAAGATTYAIIASTGALVLAIRSLAPNVPTALRALTGAIAPRTAVLIACALGFGAGILVTAAFFTPPQRADHVLYGRYVLPTLIPLLALGICRFAQSRKARLRDAAWALAVGVIAVALMAMAFRHFPHPPATEWATINVIGFFLPYKVAGDRLDWLLVGAYFLILFIVLFGASAYSGKLAARVFLAINACVAGSMILTDTLYSRTYYALGRHIITAARDFRVQTGAQLCISVEPSLSVWHQVDLHTRLFDQLAATRRTDAKPCVRGWVAPLQSDQRPPPDLRLVAAESRAPWGAVPIGLFVEHGPALDTFARLHGLPPADFPNPLKQYERNAEVVVEPGAPTLHVAPGQTLELSVHVTNTNAAMVWPHVEGLQYPMRVGLRIRGPAPAETSVEQRAEFSRTLGPWERDVVRLDAGPFAKLGRYHLTIGVLQEGVAWFDGAHEVDVDVYP